MGSDIHMFCEYRAGCETFEALSDGAFLLPPDYDMFAALAGVRAEPRFVPFRGPRGVPLDVSQHVANRYFVPVLEDERASAWEIGEHFTPAQAVKLVESGTSYWLPDGMTAPLKPATHGYVAHPDWHSASWLTADELGSALKHAGFLLDAASEEFQLLVMYIAAVAEKKGPSARVVFWFDN